MKYLSTALLVLFLAGCSSMPTAMGGYRDYEYTDSKGTVMVHRVYSNDHEEWFPKETSAPAVVAK